MLGFVCLGMLADEENVVWASVGDGGGDGGRGGRSEEEEIVGSRKSEVEGRMRKSERQMAKQVERR